MIPDIPILAVLLLFYIGGAVSNMTIFQRNRRRQHKFVPSALLFGFCMARILTCCLRIGSAMKPQNISLAIAASIFVNAGILIVYIVNLIFAQRILRARQPYLGWSKAFKIFYTMIFGLIAVALIVVIVFIVISFYTLDQHLKQVSRDLQLAAITYLLIVTMVPWIILAVSFALPEAEDADTFGVSDKSTHYKALVLAASSALCVIGASFKAGANWEAPRPASDPAWYQKKAAFYVFFFVLEIFIIYLLIITRVDKLFWVPNRSRGSYKVVTEQDVSPLNTPRIGSSGQDVIVRPKEEA